LWSVAEGKNEAHEKQADVKVFKNDIQDMDAVEVERRVLHCIT
jgi:hypothetical protein